MLGLLFTFRRVPSAKVDNFKETSILLANPKHKKFFEKEKLAA